jgi:hypothetical protein
MTRLAVWWTLLPASVPAPPPGGAPGSERGEEFGKSSPIALVVILLLGVATALLIRSMTKRLRNVPESFDPPEEGTAPTAEADDGTGDGPSDPDGSDRTGRAERPPAAGSP